MSQRWSSASQLGFEAKRRSRRTDHFGRNYSILQCDALDGAGAKRCPRRCRPRTRWHADGL